MLAAAIAGSAALGLILTNGIQRELFCHGAASLAGLLSGSPVVRVDEGWLLSATVPAVVTDACSGTHFFVMMALLLGWQLGRAGRRALPVGLLAAAAAVPLTLAVNAVRITVVVQAHRWVIPRFPESYGPFLHMLAGMAVFLPSLIMLNHLLELYGTKRTIATN